MLAAATSFFGRTAISQSYNIGNTPTSRPATPSSTDTLNTGTPFHPSLNVGLWKVQSGSHKVTGKRVSVWSFDKRGPDMERLNPLARDRALEVLKAEASALGRLRHPSILEMVEPLEETRTELVFATEPVLSSLESAIPGVRGHPLVELDEIEIQKGILQICKGLSFLNSSAQLIHSNLNPESIFINSAGDWKISGLGLTIPLLGPGGAPARWEFPTFDSRVPGYIQRSFDYMAPEYALDEQLLTASDMYSLGCVIYSVHCKGAPPFRTHGSLGGLRENAGRPVPGIDALDKDLQNLLRSLITRHANNRPTPATLPSHSFFSSLPISTLNFLDRSNFTSKTREEKISFMKGLVTVLDKFSEGLRIRKILPSLVEEMKDVNLLPYILPNVFAISNALSPTQFASTVLPSLKPLFSIKEPPQNMLTLLDNLGMLQNKTDKNVFKEHVLPLIYNALESEHTAVQERALKAIPDLCETIDYVEVQGVLFPRVAYVFAKTRVLSVKVATLTTFHSMVKTLDQTSLTQKLVPLLSKIRTKEPAVMMATLSVQEAMGFKVDREAVATLVLPQLWAMSIGPLLNVEQFKRFMSVIKRLGDRVEKEHDQFLRDSQRIEDRSTTALNGTPGPVSFAGNVDFESLVGSGSGARTTSSKPESNTSWDDDVWGSIFDNADSSKGPTLPISSRSDVVQARTSVFGAKPLTAASASIQPPSTSSHAGHSLSTTFNPPPMNRSSIPSIPAINPPQKPNYNISLSASTTRMESGLFTIPTVPAIPLSSLSNPLVPQFSPLSPVSNPPSMGSLLAPSKPPQSSSLKKPTKDDWGDFDPLA